MIFINILNETPAEGKQENWAFNLKLILLASGHFH